MTKMKFQLFKTSYLSYSIISLLFMAGCNNPKPEPVEAEPEDKIETNVLAYDSIKAKEYGADAYGMKSYVMAFLKKGPNRDLDSTAAVELQMAHMKNIKRMAEEKKLVVAGPFLDNGEIRGIYIFDVATIEEAEALTNSDPAIQAGSLLMELKPWYGSAAMMAVGDLHKTLQKTSITD